MSAIPAELLDTVTTGDARELARLLPDESVDLVFTDPVYDRIEDYRWLAEEAARVLKPNSAALVWFGIGHLPETVAALTSAGLRFRWQGLWYQANRVGARADMGFCVYSPFLWMEKGRSKILAPTNDVAHVSFEGGTAGKFHAWNKQPAVISKYLLSFSRPDALVWDPFTGGGTVPAVCKQLGRRYVAFEIDPTTAENARQRIRNTPLPLFLPDPPAPPQLALLEEVTP